MDTAEFCRVTKSRVGYRLREILGGKSKSVREKDSEGDDVIVRAYVFDKKKLRRVAKKYGYTLVTKLTVEKSRSNIVVTKLPSLTSSERVKVCNPTLKVNGNNVEKTCLHP